MALDITAVVNLHQEGESAEPSLISASRAVDAANDAGAACSLLLLLDRPDAATTKISEGWADRGAEVVVVDEGDLGQARNRAVEASASEWVAFLDGDDLWSENWLTLASQEAAAAPPDEMSVFHPAVNVIFGDNHSLLHHISSDDPGFSWSRFRLHNAWTALSFVRRADLLKLPYPSNDLEHGWGFEDWSWNMAVLQNGGTHHVVTDTCHFIRRLHNRSLLGSSQSALRSPYPGVSAPLSVPPGVSDLTTTDDDLPATHQRAPHGLSPTLLEQVGFAATIDPTIEGTLSASGQPLELAQNFNTHVTGAQQALEAIELALDALPGATVDDLVDSSELLGQLGRAEQLRVIAEIVRGPDSSSRVAGTSPLVDATLAAFPQLAAS